MNDNQVAFVAIQSKSHTVTVSSKGKRYKLFQIYFGTKGDLYVNFPYYKNSEGLVGQVFLAPNATTATLDPSCAKATSHLVKFSHHLDGETHFSQDGQVRTEIKKKSLPLKEINGHIFTVMVQGIDNFKEGGSPKYNHRYSGKKSVIDFDINTLDFEALKFVARWHSFEEITKNIPFAPDKTHIGPKFIYKDKSGTLFQGFMISPEPGNPLNGYILSLGITAIPTVNKTQEPSLFFIGGFDGNIEKTDPSKDYSFLIFKYPHIIEKGKEGIVDFESIDYVPEN